MKCLVKGRCASMVWAFVFSVLFLPFVPLVEAQGAVVSIHEIQSDVDGWGDSLYQGEEVTISGTVTAVSFEGYVVAEASGPWKAIFVYSFDNAPEIGDNVSLTGTVWEHYGMTEIEAVTNFEHLSSGNPVVATPVSVADASSEQYESVLISVEDVTVAALLDFGEWAVADGLAYYVLCDDINDYLYFPAMGDHLESITGVLFYTYGDFKIEPRGTFDIVTGEPIPHYALHGHIVTMNDSRDVLVSGYLEIFSDEIVGVYAKRPKDIPVVEAGGLIFPGLIDSHNHPSYNVLDIIPFQQQFTERSEWRSSDLNAQFNQQWLNILHYPYSYAQEANLWKLAEVRALTAGTTSIQGANCNGSYDYIYARQGIVINNVERFPARVLHDTFPLTKPPWYWQMRQGEYWDNFLIHLAEGTSDASLGEFMLAYSVGMVDERLSVIHGVPLTAPQWNIMGQAGASLVWSPASNLRLYGDTADIPGALLAGVNIALAPDWTPSGSRHLLDEMKLANNYDDNEWGDVISPLQLAEFVTRNAAKATGGGSRVGQIVPGFRANLMVIPGSPKKPYDALLQAEPSKVKLTIVDGRPMYGNPDLVDKFGLASGVEIILVGGKEKALAIQIGSDAIPEGNKPFSQIIAELFEAYEASEPKICDFLGLE